MEALSFLKFWRPTTTGNPNPITEAEVEEEEEEEEEEDDSFFDLELSIDDDFKDFDFHKPPPNHSSEPFSKRKINPIQASPIALLKSAPKLRVFKKRTSSGEDPGVSDASISKRFSRCLKLIYVKKSKKNGDQSTLSAQSSSPARKEKQRSADFGIRVVCKNLRKSKSSLSAGGIESPARRDDSLLQQHDGIQSAILHCKRSFNSSRESSMLSRLSSDSVQDSIKLSTSDSSVLSRYSSDKWMDSARSSCEDGCVFRACIGKEEEKALFPCILGVKNDSCSAEIEK